MAQLAFIGLGNMGLPMAKNLVAAGHAVTGFDLAPGAAEAAGQAGITFAPSIAEAVGEAAMVITMLPAGPQVRAVYEGPDGVLSAAARARAPGRLLDHRRRDGPRRDRSR